MKEQFKDINLQYPIWHSVAPSQILQTHDDHECRSTVSRLVGELAPLQQCHLLHPQQWPIHSQTLGMLQRNPNKIINIQTFCVLFCLNLQ